MVFFEKKAKVINFSKYHQKREMNQNNKNKRGEVKLTPQKCKAVKKPMKNYMPTKWIAEKKWIHF